MLHTIIFQKFHERLEKQNKGRPSQWSVCGPPGHPIQRVDKGRKPQQQSKLKLCRTDRAIHLKLEALEVQSATNLLRLYSSHGYELISDDLIPNLTS